MSNIIRKAYPVLNMYSTGCAINVEKAVKVLPGVADVSVSYANSLMTVTFDAGRLTSGKIRAAVLAAGYDLILEDEREEDYSSRKSGRYYRRLKMRVVGAWTFAILLMLLSFFNLPYSNVLQMVLTIPVLLFFGTPFYTGGWRRSRLGRSNMDRLVALTTSIAFLFSVFNTFFPSFLYSRGLPAPVYYEVAVFIIAFVLTGELIEEHAKGNAYAAIRQLRGFQPKVARILPEKQRIDDRVAELFLPVILVISVLTFFLWVFFGGVDVMTPALFSALSVLIMACPCAIGLATPIALVAGIGKAARHNILIKDVLALEQMRNVDVVVFDKTGTLTEGHPTVIGWLWAQSQEEHFKNVLLAAEQQADHPLAEAIVKALELEERVVPVHLDSFESITGKGIKVSWQGVEYWVGSHKLLKDFQAGLSDILGDMLTQYESEGNSIVYFGREHELLAIIAIKDQLKATSAEAIKELRALDIDICMLTGDGERTASSVATGLGILRFVADAMPEDKEDFIRELQLQGKTVAMVGDGVNDSQALSCADVSIAMGKGTDTAMDVAMITLKTSDLLLLPQAFRLSRQTVKLMRQNLFWAFIFNLIAVPVAAGMLYPVYDILLTPLLASVVMAFSCIAVALNSLR